MYPFVIHDQEMHIMMYLLVFLGVTAFLFTNVLVPVIYRKYRQRVPSADDLQRMGLFVDYFLDGKVEYILQGDEVPLYEIFFLKRDIRTLLASGIQPNFRFLKGGKEVDQTSTEFRRALVSHAVRLEDALVEYGGRLRRARELQAKAPYECLREMYFFSR